MLDDPLPIPGFVPIGVRPAVEDIIGRASRSDGAYGGLTIWDGINPRVQVHTGPTDKTHENELRDLLQPHGLKVSIIRTRDGYRSYRTATRQNPGGQLLAGS